MGRITKRGLREEDRLQKLIDEIDMKLRRQLPVGEVERLVSLKANLMIKLRNVRKRMQTVYRHYN